MKPYSPKCTFGRAACQICFLALGLGAEAGEARYRVVQLVTNEQIGARFSTAVRINRFGDVAGTYEMDMGTNAVAYPNPYELRPFVYKDETGFVSLVSTNTPFFGGPSGINDRGQVAFGGTPDNRHSYVYRYTPGVGNEWLGTFGDGEGDVASGINNRGDVVGRSDVLDGVNGWEFPFLYTDATGIMQLEGPIENFEGGARAINDLGHIALSSYGIYLYKPKPGQTPSFTMEYYGDGIPYAINNHDVIVGDEVDEQGWISTALYDGSTRRFLTLGEIERGSDYVKGMEAGTGDINDYNVVVGRFSIITIQLGQRYYGQQGVFVWGERGGLMLLNDLIEPGWTVCCPGGINDNGQIAAEGYSPTSGGVAVRLDPIPPKLAIQPGTTNLVVSWSPNWPGVLMEATESLDAPDWQAMDTGGTNVVSLPMSGASRFFRLNLEALRGLCCAPE